MKVLRFTAVLLLAVGMFSATAIAQDDCTTAVSVLAQPAGGFDPCLDTIPAAVPLGGCTSGNSLNDIWLSFVATATEHRIRTDVSSAGTDSDFIVYSGTCGSLTAIGCDEDGVSPCCLSDTCVVGLTPGATYYVQLGAWGSEADCCGQPPGIFNPYLFSCGLYHVDIEAAPAGTTCGDGIISCVAAGYPGAEECDDGNTTDGDCCSATCQDEEICGNGCIEGAEQCDDHNLINGDGCSSTCKNEYRCGNNIIEPLNNPPEVCDGTATPPCPDGSYCSLDCQCVEGIPAVSEWGLAVLTLIGLVSGTILFGRRRVAVR